MTKAKTIDRVELTRKKFSGTSTYIPQYEGDTYCTPPEVEEHYGVSECPQCQQMTLIHDGGCEHCPSCGYSRCG